jgi:hypothetical protein
MQNERPWDARLVDWMHESARHKDPKSRGPITRSELVPAVAVVAVLTPLGVLMGIGWWPAVSGLCVGFLVRAWQNRAVTPRERRR